MSATSAGAALPMPLWTRTTRWRNSPGHTAISQTSSPPSIRKLPYASRGSMTKKFVSPTLGLVVTPGP